MKKVKCELIPLERFYGIPAITFQDESYSYYQYTTQKGKERTKKIKRKNCFHCSLPAVFVGIFQHSGHKTAEDLCNKHSAKFSDSDLPREKISVSQIKSKPMILNK